MTGPAQPKGMLAAAVLFAGAGVVLAQQAWVASPRVHVPPGIAYDITALLFAAALMITFQVFGFAYWNDLLAAVLLGGVTLGVCALICGVMTGWAIARNRARRGAG